jgi:hypothetical protein
MAINKRTSTSCYRGTSKAEATLTFVFRAVVLFGYPDNTRNLLRSVTAGSF